MLGGGILIEILFLAWQRDCRILGRILSHIFAAERTGKQVRTKCRWEENILEVYGLYQYSLCRKLVILPKGTQ
jgi:hypothetical protein